MTDEGKKREKPVEEMTNEELIRSVFPAHVVERIRREHHLDEQAEELRREMRGDDQLTPRD